MPELDGQVALVTGGGRGIGANTARELASAGMRVAVGARTRPQVEEVADEIGGLALELDVTSHDSIDAAVARATAELGAIHLLVNNAGIQTNDAPLWEYDPDEWWRVYETNVRGPYLMCRAVARGMAARGRGRIVNVTSGMAWLEVETRPGASAVYASSKAAVHRFSEVLAAHLRPHGVFVFSLDPGLVRTSMTADMPEDSPWAAPELAPQLVRALASGKLDGLAGRFLHAAEDPPEELRGRVDAILAEDLNAIRLRR